jgi:hypothetical protein
MPSSSLLSHNAVGSLYTLCQSFADIMLYLITTKCLLISTPTIGVPFLALSLAFSTSYQFLSQVVAMPAYPTTQEQTTQLCQTYGYPTISRL